ncbi:GLN1 [Symbiodinium pilosum]|uniref:GLN1 protein n=1 Tax=Symbiodinium pilosum TaxID=2952 RepID=A0A812JW72_SYMPI|nr:GLN1 [Symbiodinium pilosum]
MSWAAQASLNIPASRMQPTDAEDQAAEDAAVEEKCTQLRSRLGRLPEEDLQFAVDSFTSQIRETWGLRRALAALTADRHQSPEGGARKSHLQLHIFEAEAKSAYKQELMETELCSELVREAKALAEQAESLRMRETQRDARYAHWEEAAVQLPAVLNAEGALRQRAENMMTEELRLQAQVEEWQRRSAAELLACRFEVSDLQKQCGELRGELVQAQAEVSLASNEVQAEAVGFWWAGQLTLLCDDNSEGCASRKWAFRYDVAWAACCRPGKRCGL